jgi:hypothetical protein
MKKLSTAFLFTFLFLVCVYPCFSQEAKQAGGELTDLKKDIEALKEGQKAIQKDLQEIKGLLSAKQAPPEFKEAVLSIKGDQFKGPNDAKLVLIEFFDYQ